MGPFHDLWPVLSILVTGFGHPIAGDLGVSKVG
jgi:hypothetical protein